MVKAVTGHLLIAALVLFAAGTASAQVTNISHPAGSPWASIQAAVNAGVTVSGDTITVGPSYSLGEAVVVSKPLTFLGISSPAVGSFTLTVSPVKVSGIRVYETTASGTGKIQEAIDAVVAPGTVDVETGTYFEHVVINKEVLFIGAGGNYPTIDGGGTGNCVTLAAANIRIKQFILTHAVNGIAGTTANAQLRHIVINNNTGSGITLTNSDFNFIHANTISGQTSVNGCGVELISSRGNTIVGNDIHANSYNIRISGTVFRASAANIIQGNTLVDPSNWSIQLSSGCSSSKVDFNVFSTAVTSGKFVSNTSTPLDTIHTNHNWFQGHQPPGYPNHGGDFQGAVDSNGYFDNAANTYVTVTPAGYKMAVGDPVFLAVMAMVPAGEQVRITRTTLAWNPNRAPLELGEIPGAFFQMKMASDQTEGFSFEPSNPVDHVTVFDTLYGGTGGVGPSGSIPYVGTLFVMQYRAAQAGIDTLWLSGTDVKDQNLNEIPQLVELGPNATLNISQNGAPGVIVDAKAFLQGAYRGATMDTTLRHINAIPPAQPYNTAPWNYAGNEKVTAFPADVVDWVLLELRTGTTGSTAFATRAGWLKFDGSITDIAGLAPVVFSGIDAGNYYVVVRHRNHLPIMSAAPLALDNNSPRYDFTTGQAKAFGTNPMASLGGGVFGLYAGNSNGDNVINVLDYNAVGLQIFQTGYLSGDHDMNGVVNVLDYNPVGLNIFQSSQVPATVRAATKLGASK